MARKTKEQPGPAAAGENEEQIETKTGRMPQFGTCRFCRQHQMVLGAGRCETQEEIDEIATQECDCEDGRNWRERQTSMREAEDQLQALFETEQELRVADEYLRPAIRDIGENRIRSVAIQINDTVQASIRANSKGNIIIKRKEQEINMVAV